LLGDGADLLDDDDDVDDDVDDDEEDEEEEPDEPAERFDEVRRREPSLDEMEVDADETEAAFEVDEELEPCAPGLRRRCRLLPSLSEEEEEEEREPSDEVALVGEVGGPGCWCRWCESASDGSPERIMLSSTAQSDVLMLIVRRLSLS